MPIKTLFFDLDGTLYPERNGLWQAIKQRIDRYLSERMDFPIAETAAIRQRFLEMYGTTLRGLQQEFQIDSQDYLDFVHDLPLEQYLSLDPALVRLINQLPRPRWIFTNSDIKHARRVLTILDLEDAFEGIIDIHRLQFVCKPDPAAYLAALRIAAVKEPDECLLIDDSPANIRTAAELGFQTVLVSASPAANTNGPVIADIFALPRVMPELIGIRERERIYDGRQ